jgi:glycosyltransferase involved in cell wall biosynthesis
MKVLVLTTMVPFVHGGAEELCVNLVHQLRAHGAEAEAMALPFTWEPAERLIEEMLIARSLRITNTDRVIALKFPTWLIDHPSKTVWLLHQYRQAYDLLDAGQSNIPATPRGEEILRAIQTADASGLSQVRHLYANSRVTADRLWHYNGLVGTVLPPPLNDPELFEAGPSQGYILASGRVNAGKRQHLLLEALALAPGVRLIVAGPPDTPEDAERLQSLVSRHGIEDRVRLDLRFLPRAELARLVTGAQAVAYLPFDEDSPGYVTMEACQARKPVVTVTDSGGVLDLVIDGVTGWVCAPNPEALAAALAEASGGEQICVARGAAGYDTLRGLNLSWSATIDKLLA